MSPIESTSLPPWSLASLLLLLVLVSPYPVHGQRDSAATEAEQEAAATSILRGDAHRADELWHLNPMDGALHGREHIDSFLGAWRRLLFDWSSQGMEEKAEKQPLQILHFGGSHVQAGRIGWSFRNRMAQDRPGLVIGRGIHAPHRLTGSNGPPERGWRSEEDFKSQSCANRRHRGSWGITGVEASCTGAATIACWTGSPAGENCCSSIRVLAPPDSIFQWHPDSTGWQGNSSRMASTGISRWWREPGLDVPDTVVLRSSDSSFSAIHGVEWIADGADLVFHDLGANGANSTSWMRNPHYMVQLREVAPDLVVLAWGINDAHMSPSRFNADRFKGHYRSLIDSIQHAVPEAGILLVTNNDSHYRRRHNPNAESVRTAMLELTEEEDVACWDLYGHLGGAGSIEYLGESGYAASDRLHMRKDGYVLMGELLYELLVRASISPNSGMP